MSLLNITKRKTCRIFQIFVGEEEVVLRKTSNRGIDFCSVYPFEMMNDLYAYVDRNYKIPIDVIMHTNNLSIRNLLLCNMKNSEIISGLKNNINYHGIEYNTSFYIRSGASITVCDASIDNNVADFLSWVFSASEDRPVSISCWPLWVVDNYFSSFPQDIGQFGYSLLITKSEKLSEITVVNNQLSIVCYRCFSSSNFDEKEEVSATTKYIAGLYKIEGDDIAIYSMDNSSIETFISPSNVRMSLVSKVIDDYSTTFGKYKKSLKIALGSLCCAVLGLVSWQFIEIYSLKNEITAITQKKQSFPKHVLTEKKNLEEMEGSEEAMEDVDFSHIIETILVNTVNTQVKEVELCIEGKILNINIQLFGNDILDSYSKKLKIANYDFDVFVSDSGITCNGKRC
jgi:hypothetical protein